MKRLPEITINPFQLAVLLGEVEKHFYSIVIENYVFCAQCRGFAKEGIEVEKIILSDFTSTEYFGKISWLKSLEFAWDSIIVIIYD